MTGEAATRRIAAEAPSTATGLEALFQGSHECHKPLSLSRLGGLSHLLLYLPDYWVVGTDLNMDGTAIAVSKIFVIERRMIDAVKPLMAVGTFNLFAMEPVLFFVHHSSSGNRQEAHSQQLIAKAGAPVMMSHEPYRDILVNCLQPVNGLS